MRRRVDGPAKQCETVFVSSYESELQYYLAQAAELLGGPAQPVWLTWGLERSLQQRLVLEARRGLGREPAVISCDRSKQGHELAVGIERYRWQTEEGTVRIARVVLPCGSAVGDFWAVPRHRYRRFYRMLRRHIRGREQLPPVMPKAERKRLWDNTIGFLRGRRAALARYGVTPKRGVLLLGEPGNGKTMACRWLSARCRRRGLEWRSVTAEMYDDARERRRVAGLFRLGSPGIILFDDFDTALRARDETGQTDRDSTFLGELDGLEQKTGIVFLFTSNAKLGDLDRAMCRPGRLDVVIHFPKPDAALRRQLLLTRWHPDLLAGVDIEAVVADTGGLSFAELEEARKLLVMRHVETRRWEWPWVREAMLDRHTAGQPKRPIGFQPSTNGKHRQSARGARREGAVP